MKHYEHVLNIDNGKLIKMDSLMLKKLITSGNVVWNDDYGCYIIDNNKSINIKNYNNKVYGLSPIIFIIIVLLIGSVSDSNRKQQIFDNFYYKESPITYRSSGIDSPLRKGMYFYNKGNYEMSIKTFSLDSSNMLGYLYSGLSYMELRNYKKAIEYFKYIIDNNDNLFIDQADWYMALCYLRIDENKSIVILNKIKNGNTIFNKKASKILIELD